MRYTRQKWVNVEGLGFVEVLDDNIDVGEQNTVMDKLPKLSEIPERLSELLNSSLDLNGELKAYEINAKTSRLKEVKVSRKSLIPLMLAPIAPFASSMKAFAQEPINIARVQGVTMHEKMMTAFMPIIELVQALAYPVALLVVLGGGLFVMIGNSEKGFQLIQRAGLGYVLVMMLPMLLDVLVDAMSSVV